MDRFDITVVRALGAIAVVALAACSTVERVEEPRVASESQTGSNLPKKSRTDKVQTINADSLQPLPPPFRPAGGGTP